MPLPGVALAQPADPFVEPPAATALAEAIEAFLAAHPAGALLEDGKTVFELARTRYRVSADHGRCTLQVWSDERNLVRTVLAAKPRPGMLRLSTVRFGDTQPRPLVLAAALEQRTPARKEPARQAYRRLLERALARHFPDWQVEGFRAAMDLQRSFGPAYARGLLVCGGEAWAVIGIGAGESQATVDGVLTPGILWLHHCREHSLGRRRFRGLRVVVPGGGATLTLARLAWMNTSLAEWELMELDERSEALLARDPADQGNLRTRLMHAPDEAAARERFAPAVSQVLALVPAGEQHRVEQRLRSPAELVLLLHGLQFARARVSFAESSFAHVLELSVGVGPAETVLTPQSRPQIAEHIAELFRRRHPDASLRGRAVEVHTPGRNIGAFTGRPAHSRTMSPVASGGSGLDRLPVRERALAAQGDPLFRAAPERWLESVLRENLAPLTRSLAPAPAPSAAREGAGAGSRYANEIDPDSRGNQLNPAEDNPPWMSRGRGSERAPECLIPRFDPRFVYAQVPAIAGASDRGMLDLLGVTDDGRLAVLELKASDDIHLALQGLDYWIRVRHHLAAAAEPIAGAPTGMNDLQRHGYFRDVELSPLPPRLFLIAPALQIHPATETLLRYLSPRVEWTLVALDERWRQRIRVLWRKTGGGALRGGPAGFRAAVPG